MSYIAILFSMFTNQQIRHLATSKLGIHLADGYFNLPQEHVRVCN